MIFADNVDDDLEIYFNDKEGNEIHKFTKTESASFSCASLIDSQAQLVKTKLIGKEVLETVSMHSLNGHHVVIKVKSNESVHSSVIDSLTSLFTQ